MAYQRRLSLPQYVSGMRDVDYQIAIDTILDHQTNPTVDCDPCLLLPYIYVGDIKNAESYKTLLKYGITHVLNCAGYQGQRTYQGSPYKGLPVEIHYREIKAQDNEGYDISQHFDEAFRYLDEVKRKNGCALVHCAMGINRSVAICAAYLMLKKGCTLFKTITLLKRKRGAVLTNRAFQTQLVHFARNYGLLDSQEEFDRIVPHRIIRRNGLIDDASDKRYQLERISAKPLEEKSGLVRKKYLMEPDLSFSVTTKARGSYNGPTKSLSRSAIADEKYSQPQNSGSLIENYMRKLTQRYADV